MATAAFAELDNVKAIFLQGLNERITRESIPLQDLSRLIGLRQNRLGELVRYPGESIIDIDRFDSIRGLFVLGEYVIIQTQAQLLRVSIHEIFPEIPQTSPTLFPDSYSPVTPPPPINPEEMSYSRVSYELSAGNAPGNGSANVFNTIPLNTVVNDANVRVSLAGAVMTVTAGAYPTAIRFNGWACLVGGASQQRGVLRIRNNSTLAIVATGQNARTNTNNDEIPCLISGRIALLASTDFILEIYTLLSSPFGIINRVGGVGQNEVYAQLEILVEE